MKKPISAAHINRLIKKSTITTRAMGTKTVVMTCTLPSGYETSVYAHCINTDEFDLKEGAKACKNRLREVLRELETYRLHHKQGQP